MAGFNACFLMGVGTIGWFVFHVIFRGALRSFGVRRAGWRWLSVPVFAGAVAGWVMYATRPSAVFEQSFGFAPPADVTELRTSQFILGDAGRAEVRFRAGATTVRRILARGFKPVAQPMPGFEEYTREYSGDGFSHNDERLLYDPTRGTVAFWWVGID